MTLRRLAILLPIWMSIAPAACAAACAQGGEPTSHVHAGTHPGHGGESHAALGGGSDAAQSEHWGPEPHGPKGHEGESCRDRADDLGLARAGESPSTPPATQGVAILGTVPWLANPAGAQRPPSRATTVRLHSPFSRSNAPLRC